jgi:hypothetical protein
MIPRCHCILIFNRVWNIITQDHESEINRGGYLFILLQNPFLSQVGYEFIENVFDCVLVFLLVMFLYFMLFIEALCEPDE